MKGDGAKFLRNYDGGVVKVIGEFTKGVELYLIILKSYCDTAFPLLYGVFLLKLKAHLL